MLYNIITWSATPEIFTGFKVPNWYGISWVFSFVIGFFIIKKIFKRENIPEEWADKLLMYVIISGILGARLGHCFFYDPQYYLSNPIDIFKIWEGGLASHGGAIGIIISLLIYSKKVSKKSVLWILDRVVICVAIAGCFIRLGNLVNHEIIGHPSDKALATVFTRQFENEGQTYLDQYFYENKVDYNYEPIRFEYRMLKKDTLYNNEVSCPLYEVKMNFGKIKKNDFIEISNLMKNYWKHNIENQLLAFDYSKWTTKRTKEGQVLTVNAYLVPRHPAQLYEAISYLIIFITLSFMYWNLSSQHKRGLLFGSFLLLIFGARFIVEFVKIKQTSNTEGMFLNMGHYLSIPFIIAGAFFIIRSFIIKNQNSLQNE